jgi:hypothetical protein
MNSTPEMKPDMGWMLQPNNKYALPQHNARFEHCTNSRIRASTKARFGVNRTIHLNLGQNLVQIRSHLTQAWPILDFGRVKRCPSIVYSQLYFVGGKPKKH